MWQARNQTGRRTKHARGAVRIRREPRARMTVQVNLRWLLVFVLFGTLAWSGWMLQAGWQQTVVSPDQVRIEGQFKHLSTDEVQHRIAPKLVGGYFSIDLQAVRTEVQKLPWVQDVSVRRQWPSGLLITVQEKTAVAYWNDDALLSSEGKVFHPVHIERDMALPQLAGPQGMQQSVWQFMDRLQPAFAALDRQVEKLVLDPRRAWQIHLADGTLIRLGRNQSEQRLQRFLKVFAMPNAPALGEAVVVDMRYPNGFAMLANHASNDTQTDNTDGNTKTRENEV